MAEDWTAENAHALDPCCGTGAYLAEACRRRRRRRAAAAPTACRARSRRRACGRRSSPPTGAPVAIALAESDSLGADPALIAAAGLALFGLPFAVNSALHSCPILAYAGSKRAAEDVGFYYVANAAGRLMGALLSGLPFQAGGSIACLAGSSAMLAACAAIAFALPTAERARAVP